MYSVLIADDENIILESMKVMIDWQAHELEIIADASNGVEAYEKTLAYHPDIVITDIRMPGMNGIDLITKIKEQLPDTIFLILSGYGEFEYASKAMSLGVKHYLLKPCDEDELAAVLEKIIQELKLKQSKEEMYEKTSRKLKKMMPYAKKQFLRECIASQSFCEADYNYFGQLFDVPKSKLQIILFKTKQQWDSLEKYALQNILAEVLETENIYLCLSLDDTVLVVKAECGREELEEKLKHIVEVFKDYFNINLQVGIGDANDFKDIAKSYGACSNNMAYPSLIQGVNHSGNIIINRLINYVEQNIACSDLSISWLAKNVFFMNETYLGRLFYKETNEKFSHYITRIRMERAKKLLTEEPDRKIIDICECVGFAEDTQYFSQVFKKYAGCTPTEFRKKK